MPTLAEYEKLDIDPMVKGVFDNILTTSEIAQFLQFEQMSGNSLLYNREATLPTTTFNVVGGTWVDTEPTFTQKSAKLTILGTQSPLDMFAEQTKSTINGQKAVLISKMAKSVARKIEDKLITGEPEATATEFEGLDSLVRADTRMMAMDDGVVDGPGTAETELTQDRLDSFIDLSEGGPWHAIISNKTMRRKATSIARSGGSGVQLGTIELFGHKIMSYDGIPWIIDDYITNAEQYNDAGTWSSSTATTIFGVKFGGEAGGLTLIHNGPVLDPQLQDIGIKENKNERLYRLAIYTQTVLYSKFGAAALGGIDSTA
jgi:hypothetical protein